MKSLSLLILALALLPLSAMDIILCGSGGSQAYDQKFRQWGSRLGRVLVEGMGRSETRLLLFTADDPDPVTRNHKADLEHLRPFFQELASSHDPKEDLYLYLIGHGSHLRGVTKFQIPGPDLTAEQLDSWLDKIPARRIIVVNGASASAGFVNQLSGPNRIICSATKSVGEVNAPEFMEFFIQGLEDESADLDRDQRISVWEVASQAAALTDAWYLNNGLLATEHAILDDSGDGLGTRLIQEEKMQSPDGELARTSYLRGFQFPEKAPKELIDSYLNLMTQVEALRARKAQFSSADYYRKLEEKLVAAARIHQKIRKYSENPKPK